MICWYCHWGWAKPVAEIYRRAVDKLEGYDDPLHFGPSHIVWEDENFDCAEGCLEHFDNYRGDYSDEQLEVVRQSLVELAALPMDEREIVPADYDGQNPHLFPPAVEVVRV